ncbi:hypothetical protein Aperf_G00000105550 [Anoplocephala perfoliata]
MQAKFLLLASLLLLLILGFSAAMTISQVPDSSEGDAVLQSDDQTQTEDPQNEMEKETDINVTGNVTKSPVREPKKDCNPSVDKGCKLSKNRPSRQRLIVLRERRPPGPTIAEVVVETLPNIPFDLADTLIYMQPELVNFVIESHFDLASLVAAVQTETLEYITVSAPNFAKHLSKMHPQAIYFILSKMPFPCQYIQSLKYDVAEAIVLKVPLFRQCGLPRTTTTRAPTTTTTTTTTTTQATPEAADVESMFTKNEVEKMMAKVPEIKKLLVKVNPQRLTGLRTVYPHFMDLFNQLSEKFITFLSGTFLKHFNPKNMDRKILGEMFMVMAGEDVPMQMFAGLFV